MATKNKEATMLKRADQLKVTVTNIHKEALHVSDNLVEGSLATGAKWQKIMAKAMLNGTVLFEQQQNLTMTTLEGLKSQFISGNKRFRKLFSIEMPKKAKFEKVLKAKPNKAKATKLSNVVNKVVRKKTTPKSDNIKSNLTLITGVGSKIETILNEAGIYTFTQLTKTTVKELKAILATAGSRYKSHNPATWKAQAKKLASK